jgi:hypothetical protein
MTRIKHPVDVADDVLRRTVSTRQMIEAMRCAASSWKTDPRRDGAGDVDWWELSVPGDMYAAMPDDYAAIPPGYRLMLHMLEELESATVGLCRDILRWHEESEPAGQPGGSERRR